MKVALDYSGRSLKALLKMANRASARFTLIIGDDELKRQEATLRNMATQDQQPLALHATKEQLCLDLIHLLKGKV